jgi:hypothetical protein
VREKKATSAPDTIKERKMKKNSRNTSTVVALASMLKREILFKPERSMYKLVKFDEQTQDKD